MACVRNIMWRYTSHAPLDLYYSRTQSSHEYGFARKVIECAVCRDGFLLRTLPPHIANRTLLHTIDRAVRTTLFRTLGAFQNVQTLDQRNYAKRLLSLPSEFGKLDVPSLELDDEHILTMLHSHRPSPT
jgi:hypothetical protein